MKRELQGQYVTISTVGEKARAFVPAPLPPNPPIEWRAGVAQQVRPGAARSREAGQHLNLASGHLLISLYVCTQGGGSLLHDRGDAVIAF